MDRLRLSEGRTPTDIDTHGEMHVHMWKAKKRKGKERKGGDSGRVGWWIEEGSGEEEASRIALSIIAGATK